jgi:hypothetical protein
MGADRKMMAVEIKDAGKGAGFEYGVPQPLFDANIAPNQRFDVGKDGRFLIPTVVGAEASPPINVVVNWQARLKK